MKASERDKPEAKTSESDYKPRKVAQVFTKSGDIEEVGREYAKYFTSGNFAALRVILRAEDGESGNGRDIDVPSLAQILREQGEAVNAGSLAQAEAMLMKQATALQTVFSRLVARGMGCTEIPAFEANLRMGLRAQAQCRATLETLAAIKNPASVAFVRQANIAHGPQQVNNAPAAGSRVEKTENPQSQLSEGSHELLPDIRASEAESRINPSVEAVGTINRAEVGGG